MSRIGNAPITIPAGVRVDLQPTQIRVEGPRGSLERTLPPDVSVKVQDGTLLVSRPTDARHHRALHGLTRALLANMVKGVSEGFDLPMELRGVGYRAEVQGRKLVMHLGYSHPVEMSLPEGIAVQIQTFTPTLENGYLAARLSLQGYDRQVLGDFAADLRAWRPVEPYKGKGLRYANEVVRRKLGKAAKAGDKKGF